MTVIDRKGPGELEFETPGPGSWSLDRVHVTRPATRLATAVIGPSLQEGFAETLARYGAPFAGMRHATVHGFTYTQVAPLDPGEFGAREAVAQRVLDTKLWRADAQRWDDEVKPAAIRRHRELGAVDVDDISDDELVAHLRECEAHARAMIVQHHRFNGTAMVPLGDFLAFAGVVTPFPPSVLLELFAGASPVSSGDCPELQVVLGALEVDEPARVLVEETEDPAAAIAALQGAAVAPATAAAVSEWVAVVGNRLLDGFDVYHPRAVERPAVLLASLRSALARASAAPVDVSERLAEVRAAVPAGAVAEFDSRYAEALLTYRIRDERGVYSDGTAFGIMRRAMLAAGRRLCDRGILDDDELAIEAEVEELTALLLDGTGADGAELQARRDFRAARTTADAPPYLGEEPPPPPPLDLLPPAMGRVAIAMFTVMSHLFSPPSETRDTNRLEGAPASPGVHEGRARIVHSVDDLAAVEEGDVIVAITTAECFNLALSVASAVVTDQGGLLSHAAITAREYGIPAVVGTGHATSAVRDGDWLRVDGSAGEVTW